MWNITSHQPAILFLFGEEGGEKSQGKTSCGSATASLQNPFSYPLTPETRTKTHTGLEIIYLSCFDGFTVFHLLFFSPSFLFFSFPKWLPWYHLRLHYSLKVALNPPNLFALLCFLICFRYTHVQQGTRDMNCMDFNCYKKRIVEEEKRSKE